MHCALRRHRGSNQKVLDAGNGSLLRKPSKLSNIRSSSEDRDQLSFVWRNSDQRFSFLTFLTLQPDGHWKMIALPLQYCDRSNHLEAGRHAEVDSLNLVSPPPINPFNVEQQRVQRKILCDNKLSTKQHEVRGLSASGIQHQTPKKALEKSAAKLNEACCESSHQSFSPCTDSPGFRLKSSDGTNSSDMSIDNSKEPKVAKRNVKKKTKKKGKPRKKVLRDSACKAEINSNGCVNGSSASQTCADKYSEHEDELVSCLSAPLVSLSKNESNSEGDSNSLVDSSVRDCTSYMNEADALKGTLPSAVSSFAGDHPLDCSENVLRTKDPVFCSSSREDETCSRRGGFYDDSCSKVLSEMPDSIVLDAVSIGWSSDGSANADYDDKTSFVGRDEVISSEIPSFGPRKECFCHLNSSSHVDSYNGVGACSINTELFTPGKRGKQRGRERKNFLSGNQAAAGGTLYGRPGKDNNHSVWQKVQRNDAAVHDFELKKVNSVYMESGSTAFDSNIVSLPEAKIQSKSKTSRKLKRKNSPGSKQDYSCYAKKGSSTVKASSSTVKASSTSLSTSNLQQSEISSIQSEANHRKVCSSHQIGVSRLDLRTQGVNSDGTHFHSNEFEPIGYACDKASSVNNRTTETQNCLEVKLSDSSQSFTQSSPPSGNKASEVEKGVSFAYYGKQGQSSRSISQKWIPLELKEPDSTSFRSDSSLLSPLEESGHEDRTLTNFGGELISACHSNDSSAITGALSMGQSSRDFTCSSEDDARIFKLSNQNPCLPDDHTDKHVAAHFSVCESKYKMPEEVIDAEKIARAIDDVCRARMASEAIQMKTGNPIAEFESLLNSTSPVICQSQSVSSSQSCLQSQPIAPYICRHARPRVSLGRLWHWYEKPGSYGLEVRAEDYENSKRLGIDSFAFRAYFVPYLSAVQLFGNRKRCCMDRELSEVPSNVGRLPILSLLIPQPSSKTTNSLPNVNQVPEDGISVQSDNTCEDPELLYEYFEYEPPQQRRPLFEKIKELLKGRGQSRAYGDPSNLDSLELCDVHPRSWYSVAWYPIYKIPDGNFRSAFLTYHSLGHLIHRSASHNTDVSVVSPVVGLQSYNAQGECWFRLKPAAPHLNASEILKERLRTLEQTATAMARAVVNHGNLTSVNRHPDYEFFLSRRR